MTTITVTTTIEVMPDTLPCGHPRESLITLGETGICLRCQDPQAQNSILRLFAPYVNKAACVNATDLEWLRGLA